MLGTEVWPLISANAAWIAEPSSVVWVNSYIPYVLNETKGFIRTNLIELDREVLGSQVVEETLGSPAIRAVRFREHSFTA